MRKAGELGRGFLYADLPGGRHRRAREPGRGTAGPGRPGASDLSRLPLAVGFGLSRPEHVRAVGACADAAVVGSALVSVIAEAGDTPDLVPRVEQYVRWLRGDGGAGGLRDRARGDTLL